MSVLHVVQKSAFEAADHRRTVGSQRPITSLTVVAHLKHGIPPIVVCALGGGRRAPWIGPRDAVAAERSPVGGRGRRCVTRQMQAEVGGGAQTAALSDFFDRYLGRFKQPPGLVQSLGGQPSQRREAHLRDEAPREGPTGVARVPSELGDSQRAMHPLGRPSACRSQTPPVFWNGSLHELRLAAGTLLAAWCGLDRFSGRARHSTSAYPPEASSARPCRVQRASGSSSATSPPRSSAVTRKASCPCSPTMLG